MRSVGGPLVSVRLRGSYAEIEAAQSGTVHRQDDDIVLRVVVEQPDAAQADGKRLRGLDDLPEALGRFAIDDAELASDVRLALATVLAQILFRNVQVAPTQHRVRLVGRKVDLRRGKLVSLQDQRN